MEFFGKRPQFSSPKERKNKTSVDETNGDFVEKILKQIGKIWEFFLFVLSKNDEKQNEKQIENEKTQNS